MIVGSVERVVRSGFNAEDAEKRRTRRGAGAEGEVCRPGSAQYGELKKIRVQGTRVDKPSPKRIALVVVKQEHEWKPVQMTYALVEEGGGRWCDSVREGRRRVGRLVLLDSRLKGGTESHPTLTPKDG